jgi:hypothetical protein
MKQDPKEAHPMTSAALSPYLWRYWRGTGLKKKAIDGGFKSAHGFRKYFLTNFPPCLVHGNLDAELLAGHSNPYHKPIPEHLEELYLKGQSVLTVSEVGEARATLAAQGAKHESQWNQTRVEVLTLREENAKLQKTLEGLVPLLEQIKRDRLTEKQG